MEKTMNATETQKCAHPNCSCDVSDNQQYCSTECEKSATSGQQMSASGTQGQSDCGCNHAQCRMAAWPRPFADRTRSLRFGPLDLRARTTATRRLVILSEAVERSVSAAGSNSLSGISPDEKILQW